MEPHDFLQTAPYPFPVVFHEFGIETYCVEYECRQSRMFHQKIEMRGYAAFQGVPERGILLHDRLE